jgi:hypothetical protein
LLVSFIIKRLTTVTEKIKSQRVSVQGENLSGKSTFLLTAPTPLVAFAFDLGYQRALYGGKRGLFKDLKIQVIEYDQHKLDPKAEWTGYDITIYKLPNPIQMDSIEVRGKRELYAYFNTRVGLASADPDVLTCSVDTMSAARRVRADAHLQSLQEKATRERTTMRERLTQIEYGGPNDAIRDIYNNFEALEKNLVTSHHLQDEREDRMRETRDGRQEMVSVNTGRRILEGLSKTHDLVDVAMEFKGVPSGGIGGDREFHVMAKFLKCGLVPELKDTEMVDPTWDSLMSWIELKSGLAVEMPRRVVSV